MIAVGLTAPMAGMMLAQSGVPMAAAEIPYKPTKAGGGGMLKILYWQAVTLLNPHFAVGTKDQDGTRIFYEPLAGWDSEGNLVPVLAAEIPSKENDGLAEDGLSVVWKLKRGVKWHDGKPFTADDVVFNWEYARNARDRGGLDRQLQGHQGREDRRLHRRVKFDKPTPFWADAFVGTYGMIIPKHLFADYIGGKSRDAPTNLKPVGTGPYMFVDFKPGDMVRGKLNPDYHVPNRPYFDTLEIKGGGDAVSAARAVLQTGEYDYAWNMQVEDEILLKLESRRQGQGQHHPRPAISSSSCSTSTDPATEVDGERASIKTKHPLFSDPAVRQALNLLIDRASIEKFIYGRTADRHRELPQQPGTVPLEKHQIRIQHRESQRRSSRPPAGRRARDGIRAKDGKALKFVFQTSINAPRQKTQAIIKQACQKAGIDIELKSVVASVFFSSDTANPDTYPHFYCDAQMYTTTMTQPDPQILHEPVHVVAGGDQGEQVAGTQCLALAQQGI